MPKSLPPKHCCQSVVAKALLPKHCCQSIAAKAVQHKCLLKTKTFNQNKSVDSKQKHWQIKSVATKALQCKSCNACAATLSRHFAPMLSRHSYVATLLQQCFCGNAFAATLSRQRFRGNAFVPIFSFEAMFLFWVNVFVLIQCCFCFSAFMAKFLECTVQVW